MFLVREQHLSLPGIALQQLQLQALRQQLLAILPHLLQFSPALAESLQAFAQEHVLRVVLGGRFLRKAIRNAIRLEQKYIIITLGMILTNYSLVVAYYCFSR